MQCAERNTVKHAHFCSLCVGTSSTLSVSVLELCHERLEVVEPVHPKGTRLLVQVSLAAERHEHQTYLASLVPRLTCTGVNLGTRHNLKVSSPYTPRPLKIGERRQTGEIIISAGMLYCHACTVMLNMAPVKSGPGRKNWTPNLIFTKVEKNFSRENRYLFT